MMAVQRSLSNPFYSLLPVDASQHHLVHNQVVVVRLVGYNVPHTVGVKVMNSALTTIPLPNRIHLWQKQMRGMRMMMNWLTNQVQ